MGRGCCCRDIGRVWSGCGKRRFMIHGRGEGEGGCCLVRGRGRNDGWPANPCYCIVQTHNITSLHFIHFSTHTFLTQNSLHHLLFIITQDIKRTRNGSILPSQL